MAMDTERDGLLKVGGKFGGYDVLKPLGKGGMGEVYLLRYPADGEFYACKVMNPAIWDGQSRETWQKRFKNEATFAMRVHHKNLIRVYDVGEDPQTHLSYIIMDYVSGGSLADKIKSRGRLPIDEAIYIAVRIATALEVAHRAGIVHRDIKPDNIMFDDDGEPRLADLGIAKFSHGGETETLTKTEMVFGTPAYMAPEQMMDSHHVDPRADIYSLGIVLYEMLTGSRPNADSTVIELLAKAIKGEELPNVCSMRPEVSATIGYVLSRMTAPKAADRPVSALDVATMLNDAINGTIKLPPKHRRALQRSKATNRRKHILAVVFISFLAALAAAGIYIAKSTSLGQRFSTPSTKEIIVTTVPGGAQIKCGDKVFTAPAAIQVNMFTNTPVTLTEPGYKEKELKLSFSTPSPLHVTLEKYYNINANVGGATVKVAGAIVGKTPLANYPINEFGTNTVTVSKPGWLDAKLEVTPETPTDIMLTMEKDVAGRYLPEIIPNANGVEVKMVRQHFDAYVDDIPNSICRLTDFGDADYLHDFCMSPDGKTILASVIRSEIDKNRGVRCYYANLWQIFTSGNDNSMKMITRGDAIDITPTISGDGNTLYFSSNRNGRLGIWSLDMNGASRMTFLSTANTSDYYPAINPQCDTLVYSAAKGDAGGQSVNLWTMAADSKGRPGLLRQGYNAVWSPDGTKILFVNGSRNDNEASLWFMDANGTNCRLFMTAEEVYKSNYIDPRWSPDGTKIVFASNRGTAKGIKNYDIWMMDADGRNMTQLTTNSSCDDHPVFAPDGKTIYFRSNRGGTWNIWLMKLQN